MATNFDEVIDRAAREAWPFWRLIDAIDALPPRERPRAAIATLKTIADELDRRRPTWRERAPARDSSS